MSHNKKQKLLTWICNSNFDEKKIKLVPVAHSNTTHVLYYYDVKHLYRYNAISNVDTQTTCSFSPLLPIARSIVLGHFVFFMSANGRTTFVYNAHKAKTIALSSNRLDPNSTYMAVAHNELLQLAGKNSQELGVRRWRFDGSEFEQDKIVMLKIVTKQPQMLSYFTNTAHVGVCTTRNMSYMHAKQRQDKFALLEYDMYKCQVVEYECNNKDIPSGTLFHETGICAHEQCIFGILSATKIVKFDTRSKEFTCIETANAWNANVKLVAPLCAANNMLLVLEATQQRDLYMLPLREHKNRNLYEHALHRQFTNVVVIAL